VTRSLHAVLLYNTPLLRSEDPNSASEAGVLESVAALRAAFRASGHQVSDVAVNISLAAVVEELEEIRPDVVVNLCESFAGNSIGESHIAAVLELLGVAYTGCSPECLAVSQDKPRAKRLLLGAGLPTPEFVEVARSEIPPEQLKKWLNGSPLIVKPATEDASLGIGSESVVTEWRALLRQITRVHNLHGNALVERFIPGREFNVGIIEIPELQLLPIGEIDFHQKALPHLCIVTYDAKWVRNSQDDLSTPVCCPANIGPALARKLEEIAVKAYRLVGCRDYARIDFRVDDQGQIYVLEVNANPDIGPEAGLARMLHGAGIPYYQFGTRLLNTAVTRRKILNSTRKLVAKVSTAPNSSQAKIRSEAHIRDFRSEDRQTLVEIVYASGVFRADEIRVADEVLGTALHEGATGDYHVLVAESHGHTIGWSCHGRVPLTDATFDLYWIAVAPNFQKQGIGKQLIARVESRIQAAGGRWLLAETSSTAAYQSTRLFYRSCGFHTLSEIDDFYRLGDGKITFGKRIA
jgi:D-alanine-D-alanine ligase